MLNSGKFEPQKPNDTWRIVVGRNRPGIHLVSNSPLFITTDLFNNFNCCRILDKHLEGDSVAKPLLFLTLQLYHP
jgi:hypothetical protein